MCVCVCVFPLAGWRKGRGGCVRNIGHKHDFCQAQKAENTDPRANYALKYATARGLQTVGLPRKQKIAVNKLWVQESEIGEESRQFWP